MDRLTIKGSDNLSLSRSSFTMTGSTTIDYRLVDCYAGGIAAIGTGTSLVADANGTISNTALDAESGAMLTFAQTTSLSGVNLTENGGGQDFFSRRDELHWQRHSSDGKIDLAGCLRQWRDVYNYRHESQFIN